MIRQTAGSGRIPGNSTTLTITNTSFTGNTASEQGGGIWLGRHPAGIDITNTTLSTNTATNSNGGAILLGDNGKLSITIALSLGIKLLVPIVWVAVL